MKKLLGKLKNNAGFTLMEMTVAVAVLVLLATAMTSGLVVSTRTYRESVFISNSEILYDTLNTALSDVLRYAAHTKDEDGIVYFSNDQYNILSGGHFVNEEGRVYIDTGAETSEMLLILNSGAYTELQVTEFSMAYDAGTHTYSGAYKISSEDGLMIKDCTFAFRSLR